MRAELYKTEHKWRVSEHKIQLVNTQRDRPIESAGLYNLAKELLRHPGDYANIIRTMRERSALHSHYAPNPIPNFINKPKPELVLSPPKLTDVFKEEMCRGTARQAFRKEQMKSPF